jgi:hypothetical protein
MIDNLNNLRKTVLLISNLTENTSYIVQVCIQNIIVFNFFLMKL